MRPFFERQQYVNVVENDTCDDLCDERVVEPNLCEVVNDDDLGDVPPFSGSDVVKKDFADVLHDKLKHLSADRHDAFF
jgi:hypothetical protein